MIEPIHVCNKRKKSNGEIMPWFLKLLENQDYKCLICESKFNENKLTLHALVDHDHMTGRIRGILCRHCNIALGFFKDDTSLLAKAIKYLDGSL